MPGPSRPVRVLIAEDQSIFADALAMLLETDDRVIVVGTAANGQEAVDQALSSSADVVVMDMDMPVVDGLEATRRLRKAVPEARVIVVSGLDPAVYEQRALDAGATSYVLKGRIGAEMVEQILAASNAG
ncbi:MAG: response regulator transcription factor [Actinomycetota bacterium]|nr:response regulator transcription factor [Actinomycetota bacterium]